MIVCVLGMHKSGTTLVAETLHRSGIDMGVFDERLGYDDGNQFERHEAINRNRGLLSAASIPTLRGARAALFLRYRGGYQPNADADSIVRSSQARVVPRQCRPQPVPSAGRRAQRAPLLLGVQGSADPSARHDVWRRALPEHRVIAVYRRFDEVMSHFKVKWDLPAADGTSGSQLDRPQRDACGAPAPPRRFRIAPLRRADQRSRRGRPYGRVPRALTRGLPQTRYVPVARPAYGRAAESIFPRSYAASATRIVGIESDLAELRNAMSVPTGERHNGAVGQSTDGPASLIRATHTAQRRTCPTPPRVRPPRPEPCGR